MGKDLSLAGLRKGEKHSGDRESTAGDYILLKRALFEEGFFGEFWKRDLLPETGFISGHKI